MDPCVVRCLLTSRAWNLCPREIEKGTIGRCQYDKTTAMSSVLGALEYLARESRPDQSGHVSNLQSRFNEAQVSDILETEWSDWLRLIQISYCPYAKFLWIKSALRPMEMPVVEIPVLNEHKLGL